VRHRFAHGSSTPVRGLRPRGIASMFKHQQRQMAGILHPTTPPGGAPMRWPGTCLISSIGSGGRITLRLSSHQDPGLPSDWPATRGGDGVGCICRPMRNSLLAVADRAFPWKRTCATHVSASRRQLQSVTIEPGSASYVARASASELGQTMTAPKSRMNPMW